MDGSDTRLFRAMLVLLIALLVAVPVIMLLAMGLFGSELRSDWGMMGSWTNGWGWMMIIPVVIVVVLVIVLVLLAGSNTDEHMRQYHEYQGTNQGVGDPFEILNRRLASGAITVEEYTRIKNQLTRP